MSRSPIPRALSILLRHRVRNLLMGGQACILYGAAEFSRDIDIAIAVGPANLGRLRAAFEVLEAEQIFFPALSAEALRRGHACHFRCLAPGMHRLRIDIMSKMRGVDTFDQLWKRRERIDLPGVGRVAVLSLRDLVKAKKTQRDKDWPMIRRLVEADIARAPTKPGAARIGLWLRECRTAELLCDLAERYPRMARQVARRRAVVAAAVSRDVPETAALLSREEAEERERDRSYWAPLRAELERWRRERRDA